VTLQDPAQSQPGMAFVIAMLSAIVIILWPLMRAFARRLDRKGNVDSVLEAEVEQLHNRLADVESLQARVLELEERVDFAERLLSQTQDAQKGMIRGGDR
jgi:uncharacterized protein involved in exopolysaccharide biosynthesis